MSAPVRNFLDPQPDFNDRSILITGGTGSFGRQFVRTVLQRWKPRRLIVFSRDEAKQHDMALELEPEKFPSLRFFIGDVRDSDRLEMAMRGVDYVIHAAALKHVPTAEYNPFECIRTNVHGAENIVKAAIRCGVQRVIALSTDKACNPVNLYGASKLASDKIFAAAGNLSGADNPRFATVRYGNVIGSRGGVVELYAKLIANRAGFLPITDVRMTRFWITLEQGINFVLSSLVMMSGGEMFVPRIPSMKIVDLAHAMAPDIEHKIIGIRPGEKLHELMITEDDGRTTYRLPDRYIIPPVFFLREGGHYNDGGAEPVGDRFSYSSNSNDEWLDAAYFTEMTGSMNL